MATYYHGGSEIQADGLQTLYLMNPNYVGYSDTQPPANMLFLNSATGNALNPANISHAPPSKTQHFVGIPLPTANSIIGSANSDDPNRQSIHQHHEIQALQGVLPRFHYNLWGSTDQSATGSHPHIPTAVPLSDCGGTTQLGFSRPVVSPTQQGLSLSLSPKRPVYRSFPTDHDIPVQTPVAVVSPRGGEGSSSVSAVSNGISGMQSVILGSKYLQAAQQLLDEVVNVGKRIKGTDLVEGTKERPKANRESVAGSGGGGGGSNEGKSSTKGGDELTTAERQEIQMKKGKLVSMLDEVEQRYRQYHYQMQIVVTSFEQATGLGSAKSYTALALQTISKQFRCLKDAIYAQIKDTSKSLGEEDCIGGKVEGSKLKFVDHQIRQQRALQNLGMMQHNAWRPQRGLPERAVSVLRAWLFEHFLHPYPKDSDKHLLAKQTGLTRSQVSNWFINARVRLWKPMVEEMYLEEFKEQEQTDSGENKSRSTSNKDSELKSTAQLDQINTLKSKQGNPLESFSKSPKKPRNEMQNSPSSILSVDMDTKHSDTIKGINDRFNRECPTSNGVQFGTYNTIGELGRFTEDQLATGFQGNGVSLTLGLPHCDNLSLSATHHNFLSNQNIQLGSRLDIDYSGINNQQASQSNTAYENINIQNRKRFAAQLLHDFVA